MNNKNKEECVWIGIGINITPSDHNYGELLKLNTFLVEKYGSTFIFDPKTNQPHINLYDLDVPKDNLEHIERVLQEIVKDSKSFRIEFDKIDSFKHGTIFISCKTNHDLEQLEKQVVENVVQYKGDCRTEDYWQPWRGHNERQIANRDKYGNPHVLDTFLPHITIGFIRGGQNKLEEVVREANQRSTIKQIHCGNLDLVAHDQQGKLIYSKRFPF